MSKLNDEAAPNLNLKHEQIEQSNFLKKKDHEFAEELSDGAERNEIISKLSRKNKQ